MYDALHDDDNQQKSMGEVTDGSYMIMTSFTPVHWDSHFILDFDLDFISFPANYFIYYYYLLLLVFKIVSISMTNDHPRWYDSSLQSISTFRLQMISFVGKEMKSKIKCESQWTEGEWRRLKYDYYYHYY